MDLKSQSGIHELWRGRLGDRLFGLLFGLRLALRLDFSFSLLLRGQLHEDVFEAEINGAHFQQVESLGNDARGDLRPQIRAALTLDLGGDQIVRARQDLDALDALDRRDRVAQALGRAFDLNANTLAAFELCSQVLGRVDGGDAALVDNDHAVAGHLDLGQDVRREDDRVLPGQIFDQAADFLDLVRVESDGRFV